MTETAKLVDVTKLIEEFEWLKSQVSESSKGEVEEYIQRLRNAPTVEAVILPCKLGTQVFIVGSKYRSGCLEGWINTGKFRLSDLDKIGKTVFLTKEDADAALKNLLEEKEYENEALSELQVPAPENLHCPSEKVDFHQVFCRVRQLPLSG